MAVLGHRFDGGMALRSVKGGSLTEGMKIKDKVSKSQREHNFLQLDELL
ncbi:Avr9 elicitor response protein [Corchorus olitorius]|uniref:Avr9 elicitor response protein n=1 Tax=Corchorus olitorius TaxID=93759 RepID=A0A1R3L1J0_9ROSI|nr:Avr9 elicitor response protein [Corchorus olitorius]OMP13213.1 Avr9 elicitor response protein [Corchorus olitorius]